MTDSKDRHRDPAELRRQAEKLVEKAASAPEDLSAAEAARLIHELQVYQMELEIQNEDLRAAQVEVSKSRNQYADLYHDAPVGYLTLDESGRITAANLTAAHLLGVERRHLVEHYFWLFLAEADRPALRRLLDNVSKFPERRGEFRFQIKEKVRTMLLNLRFFRDEGRDTCRLALTDVTDLKEAQAALKESGDQLRQLNATLEQRIQERTAALEEAVRELEQANRELESFSYSVSHDLKTPVRAIQGFSRMILEEHLAGLDEEGRRLFQVVIDNTHLMDRLIDDLLNLARLARQPVNKMPVDLINLAQSTFKRLISQEPARNLQLIAHDAPLAWGDHSLLQQVLQNLLDNAIKFTRGKDSGIIEVGGRAEGGETIYFVRDNGAGFDEAYAHKLFQVFQRLHGREAYEGTGVGLATVQRIIQRHGGRVWAEGKVGKGAAFYFALPPPPAKRRD